MASTPLSASVDRPSILSDALLRHLMAVGQVDILVGLPTLNNAATVDAVARAIHVCFTRDYPRLRTVMINSDAGSTDGTPERIRDAALSEEDVVQTSHALRTVHRVVTPYHGLPDKHTALRAVFAATELTQAKALVMIDPAGPSLVRLERIVRGPAHTVSDPPCALVRGPPCPDGTGQGLCRIRPTFISTFR